MAKRKAPKAKKTTARKRKQSPPRRSGAAAKAGPMKKKIAKSNAKKRTSKAKATRRTSERPVQTPPSSLNMNRRGTAARSGRAEMKRSSEDHRGMSNISGGDVDVDVEQAYFSGDEAPGGDNPTPDQEVVDEIGAALGVEYQDNEELGTTEKVTKRDKHRWELDPASAEDYKERK